MQGDAMRQGLPRVAEIPVLGIEPGATRDGAATRRTTAWAWRQWVSCPQARFVLVALAGFVGDDATCAFRTGRLAKLTCLSEHETQSALGRLAALGLVRLERRADGYMVARLLVGAAS